MNQKTSDDPTAVETLLRDTTNLSLDYLRTLPERPVHARAPVSELRDLASAGLPRSGAPPSEVLRNLAAIADAGVVATAGPRYFGFVIGGSHPAALAADWLVSTWDQNSGIYATSPFTSVIEEVASRWMVELLSLPSESTVGFVTGCQMANFTCLAAARHALFRRVGWDVEQDGFYGAPEIDIVLSEEAHATILTSLRYLGFGTGRARLVKTDGQGRMIVSDLARILEECHGPTLVCAQAGNVNSGAFDPLDEIAPLTAARGAWLHVDGAFGLWAKASPDLRHLANGAEKAQSWATDAHKWLNVPYDCGVAIVRNGEAHRGAMSIRAAYLEHAANAERDPFEYVPEFSRRARSVPVYAALQALGTDGVKDLIERCCSHARLFASLLETESGVEILNDVVLNQVLVRFGSSDELTRQVVAGVQDEGTCWLGGTTWKNLAAMRISVSNWSTSVEDVQRSVAAIVGVYRKLRR